MLRPYHLFTISGLLLLSVASSRLWAQLPDFPAQKIAAHTWVIHGPLGLPSKANQGFMNNPGFIITQTGVVVIDPGSTVESGRMVLHQIRKQTRLPVTHVLGSHIHGDHWLGNQAFAEAFPDAKFMAHPLMIKKAREGAAEQWVATMERMTGGLSKGTRAVIPGKALDEGASFETGGIHFRIHAPPGAHSGNDIMIEVVEDGVIFLGDNALVNRIGRMDDGSFRGNIRALDAALATKAKHFVPGHGPSGDRQVAIAYKNYLSTLYQRVAVLYEEGLADFEMKKDIVARLEQYQDWVGFKEEVGRHISLAMLEVEKAEFE